MAEPVTPLTTPLLTSPLSWPAFDLDAAARPLDAESRDAIASVLGRICVRAGHVIRTVLARGVVAGEKPDGSACTDADLAAELSILADLAQAFPQMAVVAEETAASMTPPAPERFFLVDPIDGTSEFVAGGDGYTVNIALIENGAPIAGAILAPARERLWIAGATARMADGALSHPFESLAWAGLQVRAAPAAGFTVLASARHGDAETEAWLARLKVLARTNASSSLKFCAIAAGEADVYPRFGRTMEWDTAAGQAILEAAGGLMVDPRGRPFRYGDAAGGFANGPFIAWGDGAACAAFTTASPA